METRPNEMRQLEDTVSLEGAICSRAPEAVIAHVSFFWREAWLRRIAEP